MFICASRTLSTSAAVKPSAEIKHSRRVAGPADPFISKYSGDAADLEIGQTRNGSDNRRRSYDPHKSR